MRPQPIAFSWREVEYIDANGEIIRTGAMVPIQIFEREVKSRYEPSKEYRLKARAVCSIQECHRPVIARSWCHNHYRQWREHGDPLKRLYAERGKPMQWLVTHINYNREECLIWPFARTPQGYAKIASGIAIRVMCEAAHGSPPTPNHVAAHSCGNGHEGCISPMHLRWATISENNADKIVHGTLINGERHYRAIMTEQKVREIKTLADSLSCTQIAERYGVSFSCIWGILRGKNWKHIQ